MSHTIKFGQNPYTAGPPVDGEKFYNREELVEEILSGHQLRTIVPAIRRMGKTSLLCEIKRRIQESKQSSKSVCLNWNLQGAKDPKIARKRLLSYKNRRNISFIDWDNTEEQSCVVDVLRNICAQVNEWEDGAFVFLLIDEPDILLKNTADPQNSWMIELQLAFEEIENLKVIVVGPPYILESATSGPDGLFNHFSTFQMKRLGTTDAEALIFQNKDSRSPQEFSYLGSDSQTQKATVRRILEISNHVPFYIQLICFELFQKGKTDEVDRKPLNEVLDSLATGTTFHTYFKTDFREFNPVEKLIVLRLAEIGTCQQDQLIQSIKEELAELGSDLHMTKSRIDRLVNVLVVRRDQSAKASNCSLSNPLFAQWLMAGFESYKETAKKDVEFFRKAPETDPLASDQKTKLGRRITDKLNKNQLEPLWHECTSALATLEELKQLNESGDIDPTSYIREFRVNSERVSKSVRKLAQNLPPSPVVPETVYDLLYAISGDNGSKNYEALIENIKQEGLSNPKGRPFSEALSRQTNMTTTDMISAVFRVTVGQ